MKKIFLIYCLLCALVKMCFAQVPVQQPYPTTPILPNVAEVEAYVGNTDPGIGNGTPITIPTGTNNATATNVTLNFTAQPNGVQFVYVRSRDVLGRWSLTSYKQLVVGTLNYPTAPTVPNVAEVEAYVGNTDPGFGNATPITIPTGVADATATNTTLNFTAQPNGIQFLYIRSRDVLGRWSVTNYKQLVVGNINYAAAPILPNVAALEYYVGNTDPGSGNGTNITIPTGLTNVTATNTTITFPATPDGTQTLYLRSRDVLGRWSIVNYRNFVAGFNNYPTPPALPNVLNLEAYVGNTDPGFGNGTPISIPTGVTDATVSNVTFNFPALTNGSQFLYVRSRDVIGRWSQTNYKLFSVGSFNYPVSPPLSNIAELEYYVGNNDPGFGNGTNITIPTGVTDATATNTTITFPAQPNGIQYLYLRSRDIPGKWSATNYKQFLVGQLNYSTAPATPPNIGNLEYYVDNDPGFGNGTAISFPAASNVQLTNISTLISGTLTNGTHTFHIRSKQNPWSLDNAKTFIVGAPVPLTWGYITAALQNGQTLVSWATQQEINTSKFEIERSINAIQFEKIGEQLATGNSTTLKEYQHKDAQPAIGFNYYRIKQIDLDGRFNYSTTVKVLNNKNIKEAFIAPNPIADMINLVEPFVRQINLLEVFDSRGTVVIRKNVNSKVQVYSLPVPNLLKGNYVLKITYDNDVKSISFIK
jgi:ribosomal protein L7Ae-like RNA K-turn-binding protein